VRSVDDPRLVDHLAELGIPLEVCPTSNVATGACASLADHPFPRLRDAGAVVTLNSDDPSMFGSWVSDEYHVARDVFGYDDAALADIAATGVRASFADDDDKQRMLSEIAAWLADG
jgi:adenosine deaminase